MLKRILPILLIIWPYTIVLLMGIEDEDLMSMMMSVYMFLSAAVYAANIINAFLYKGERAASELALFGMLMKIVHIPFYLIVFVLGVAFLFASVVPALIFVTPFLIFMLFVIDVLLMLTSSMYGINALRNARKNDIVSTTFAIVNGVMHLFFVTDVISSMIVFVKVRKKKQMA